MDIEQTNTSTQLAHGGDAYNIAGFILCSTLLIWRIVHHILWRDEAQAWLIVQAANSFWDLLIVKGEGHPPLYYWILYLTSGLGDDLWLVKIPTLIFASATLAAVWFLTPFTPLERLMVSLGYFLSWQYGVFSRSYVVGAFFIILYAALHNRWRKYPVLGGLVLGAAALTHVFFAMAAACLAGLTVSLWLKQETNPKQILLLMLPFAICLALSAASFVLGVPPRSAASLVLGVPPRQAFVGLVQSVTQQEHWSVGSTLLSLMKWLAKPFLKGVPLAGLPLKPSLSILVLGLLAACFWRKPVIGLVFFVGAVSIAAFQVFIYGSSKHSGVIYLLFVAVYAIAYLSCNKVTARGLLALSMLGGLATLPPTLITPYSASQEAAEIITARGLEHATWVAMPELPATATFAALKRSVYGLECGCEFTYVDRARNRINRKSVHELGDRLQKFIDTHAQSEIFILVSKPYVDEFKQMLGDRAVALIAETQPPLNDSEDFAIYKVLSRPNASQVHPERLRQSQGGVHSIRPIKANSPTPEDE